MRTRRLICLLLLLASACWSPDEGGARPKEKKPTETVGTPEGYHVANLRIEYEHDVVAYRQKYLGRYVRLQIVDPQIARDARGYYFRGHPAYLALGEDEARKVSAAIAAAKKLRAQDASVPATVILVLRFIPDPEGFGFHGGLLDRAGR